MEDKKNRIEWIDYLKAFACFLVVFGHAIQSTQSSGIDKYMNITTFIMCLIYLFHMPVFMCMSGFLYCKNKKEFSWKNYKDFEFKKIINLIVPYLTFYLISIGINFVFSSSTNHPMGIEELLGIVNNPIAPYWFLYALISIFIVVPLLEKLFKNNTKIIFGIFVLLKVISIFFVTNIYFIDSIMKHAIYFYVGNFLSSESKATNKYLKLFAVICYILAYFGLYQIKTLLNNSIYEMIVILFAISGILICVNIFKGIKKSFILDTFKKYTFQIYIMHIILGAGTRIILFKIGIDNYFVHLIMYVLVGIYGSSLVSVISNKIKYTDFFFFPLKTIKIIKENRKLKTQN